MQECDGSKALASTAWFRCPAKRQLSGLFPIGNLALTGPRLHLSEDPDWASRAGTTVGGA